MLFQIISNYTHALCGMTLCKRYIYVSLVTHLTSYERTQLDESCHFCQIWK